MRLPIAFIAAAAGLGCATAASAASVEIKDAVARVTVIPEDRSDIKVEFLTTNPSLPLTVRSLGDRTIVDGDLDRRIYNCDGEGESVSISLRGVGSVRFADMPQVVIRTPRDVHLRTGGAVFGSIGRSASLDFANAGCGDWTIGNVQGDMKVTQAGSGDTRTGSAGTATLRVAGSGDMATADVGGSVNIDIAGSGSVSVARVNGPVDVSIAGSGDVKIAGGSAPSMVVKVAGSGDVAIDGTVGDLTARVAGSGDIRAKAVTGEIKKTIAGSGDITIGG